jgi:1,4-dihydroxy-2-naphthoate octaprenyltransferase
VAGWLIQFAGVVTDNYENLVREPDDREHPELVGAVRSGLLTLARLRTTILVSYGLAILAGVYLTYVAGWPVVAIGLVSIAASWAYSAGPWPFGRAGLADPLFFLFFGVVSVAGVYYVQAQTPSWSAVAFGVPIGALSAGILVIDDIRDRAFDTVKGKRTIAVRFGIGWSRAEFAGWLTAAYAAPVWFWLGAGFPATVLLPLASLPLALVLTREVFRRETFAELVPMTPRAAQLTLLFAALLAAGVAVSPLR